MGVGKKSAVFTCMYLPFSPIWKIHHKEETDISSGNIIRIRIISKQYMEKPTTAYTKRRKNPSPNPAFGLTGTN